MKKRDHIIGRYMTLKKMYGLPKIVKISESIYELEFKEVTLRVNQAEYLALKSELL